MQFTCPCGQKELSIPEDKLPAADVFALKCPHCDKKVRVDKADPSRVTSTFAEPQAEQATAGAPAEPTAPPAPTAPPVPPVPTVEPDNFPPGAKVAFLMLADGGWKNAAESFFKAKDYEVSTADDPAVALQKVRLNDYDVVVTDNTSLLDGLGELPGLKRRSLNVMAVAEGGESQDSQKAFTLGVNSFLAVSDSGKAQSLLEDGLKAYDLYYEMLTRAQEALSAA